MSQQFKKTQIATYVCIALSASASALAAEEAKDKNKAEETEVITVTGVRSSLTGALAAKRSADSISDSIIAEEIGKSSDENIAEALSRISGVSLDRSGGDNQTVTVRGVQASLNDIKLNGVSMSSNTDNQAVDLSLFSADVLSRIDVVKSPSANQEEGSLGAAINLQTRAPLSANKNTNVVTIEARHNDLQGDTTPRFSYTGVYQFSDKVGVAGSLFYDKKSVRKEEFNMFDATLRKFDNNPSKPVDKRTKVFNTDGEELTGVTYAVAPDFHLARMNLDDKLKTGGTVTLQYRPTDDTDIRFDASFSRQEIDHKQTHTRYHNMHLTPAEVIVAPGDDKTAASVVGIKSGKAMGMIQSGEWINTTDNLILGLQFEHALNENWMLSGRVGHAATDQAYTDGFRMNWFAKTKSDFNDPQSWCGVNYQHGPEGDFLPEFSHCAGFDGNDPSTLKLDQMRSDRRDVDDTKNSVYFDASRVFDNGVITSVEFGVKYTDRSKSVSADELFFASDVFENRDPIYASDIEGSADSGITGGEFLDGIAPAGLPTEWLYPDVDATIAHVFPNGLNPDLFVANPLKAWAVDEKTYGAYVQANYELLDGDLSGNIGIRYANTEIVGMGTAGAEYHKKMKMLEKDEFGRPIEKVGTAITDQNDYDNWLPSLTVNYLVDEDIILRASAARVMARTGLDGLNPAITVKARNVNETPKAKGGNTKLDAFVADQYDVALEWYFEEGALLSGALFYKDFGSFTYNTTEVRQFDNQITGDCVIDRSGLPTANKYDILTEPCADIPFESTVSGGTAFIKGAEIGYQQNYDFLPGLLSYLGSSLNYTYADSEAIVDPTNADNPFNGLPFLNTSKHSANATLYWEDEKLSVRLAYAYRTKALSKTSSKNSSIVRDDRGTLDLSVNYALTKDLKLTFSASNLTNSYDRFINVVTNPGTTGLTKELNGDLADIPDQRTHAIFNYGQDYRLSLRYSF